jgi:hypothetical protein
MSVAVSRRALTTALCDCARAHAALRGKWLGVSGFVAGLKMGTCSSG